MPREELEQLSEHAVRFARRALDKDGEFRPFGATVDGQGQLQYCVADDGSESQDFRTHIEILKRYLREITPSGQIHAVAFCFDILHRDGNPKQEAIQCSLGHADDEARTTLNLTTRGG
jgi:hypothetical protein